jgi:hypothetical protein
LEFTVEGFQGPDLNASGLVHCGEGRKESGCFAGSDRNGSIFAINVPAQNFFSSGPDAINEEFLVGNWVFHGAAGEGWWREYVMDGVEQRSGNVQEFLCGLCLQVGDEVVHVDFKEMGQGNGVLDRCVEFLEGTEVWVGQLCCDCCQEVAILMVQIHCYVLEWVRGEGFVLVVIGCDIPRSFGCCAKVWWAVTPTHL